MKKFINHIGKNLILSLIIIIFLMALIYYGYVKYFNENVFVIKNTTDQISMENEELFNSNSKLEMEEKNKQPIKPKISENFGTLKIPIINVELPIFYGTTSDLLKKGVGHDNSSYIPGEGGSIILMGHNFKQFLGSLPKANIGDEIQIITNYGEYKYNIYDTKIVKETEVDKVPVQKEEEILMIYTCWPINNVTHANERYVVYAK